MSSNLTKPRCSRPTGSGATGSGTTGSGATGSREERDGGRLGGWEVGREPGALCLPPSVETPAGTGPERVCGPGQSRPGHTHRDGSGEKPQRNRGTWTHMHRQGGNGPRVTEPRVTGAPCNRALCDRHRKCGEACQGTHHIGCQHAPRQHNDRVNGNQELEAVSAGNLHTITPTKNTPHPNPFSASSTRNAHTHTIEAAATAYTRCTSRPARAS
jgi:hypothetical protein